MFCLVSKVRIICLPGPFGSGSLLSCQHPYQLYRQSCCGSVCRLTCLFQVARGRKLEFFLKDYLSGIGRNGQSVESDSAEVFLA